MLEGMSKNSKQKQPVRRRDLVELILHPFASQFTATRMQIQELHDLVEIIAREIQRQACRVPKKD